MFEDKIVCCKKNSFSAFKSVFVRPEAGAWKWKYTRQESILKLEVWKRYEGGASKVKRTHFVNGLVYWPVWINTADIKN